MSVLHILKRTIKHESVIMGRCHCGNNSRSSMESLLRMTSRLVTSRAYTSCISDSWVACLWLQDVSALRVEGHVSKSQYSTMTPCCQVIRQSIVFFRSNFKIHRMPEWTNEQHDWQCFVTSTFSVWLRCSFGKIKNKSVLKTRKKSEKKIALLVFCWI